jgi:hypothetical protein
MLGQLPHVHAPLQQCNMWKISVNIINDTQEREMSSVGD